MGEAQGGTASVGASGGGGGPRSTFNIALRTRHFNLKGFSYGHDPSGGESRSRGGHGAACPTKPAGEQAFFLHVGGGSQGAQSHHSPVLSPGQGAVESRAPCSVNTLSLISHLPFWPRCPPNHKECQPVECS